jgi:hypothetical protein
VSRKHLALLERILSYSPPSPFWQCFAPTFPNIMTRWKPASATAAAKSLADQDTEQADV